MNIVSLVSQILIQRSVLLNGLQISSLKNFLGSILEMVIDVSRK